MSESTYLQAPPKRKLLGLVAVVVLHSLLFWAIQAGLTRTVIQKMPVVVQALLLEEKRVELPPTPPAPTPPPPKPAPPAPSLPAPTPPAFIPPAVTPAAVAPPQASAAAPVTAAAPVQAPTPAPAAPTKAPVKGGPVGIFCEKPKYPRASTAMEEEGTVTLNIFLGIEGNVLKATVEKSSGFKRLDEAARNEVMRWRFKPATVDEKPVEYSFFKTFNFSLDPALTQATKSNEKQPC